MNYSLKTKDFDVARQRRDRILADLDSKGLLKKRKQECTGNSYAMGARPRNPNPIWEHWEWRNPEDKIRYEAWLKENPYTPEELEAAKPQHSLFGDKDSKDTVQRTTGVARGLKRQNIKGGRGNTLLPLSMKTPINSNNK